MHLPIWLLGQVPKEVCDIAVTEFEATAEIDATMGESGDIISHSHRNTSIRFANPDHWFGSILYSHALKSNKDNQWNYNITFHENLQYAKYGINQHYNWHVDIFPLSIKDYQRKITVVCLLNNPSEYEGGNLDIRLYQDYTVPLQKGTMVAFPSMLEHRVTPVLSGIRKSATIWLNGNKST
jgi:PKHD-type hydroxylase